MNEKQIKQMIERFNHLSAMGDWESARVSPKLELAPLNWVRYCWDEWNEMKTSYKECHEYVRPERAKQLLEAMEAEKLGAKHKVN